MKNYFNLNLTIRISNDSDGSDRYTKQEIIEAILSQKAEIVPHGVLNGSDSFFILDKTKTNKIMGVIEKVSSFDVSTNEGLVIKPELKISKPVKFKASKK